MAVKQVFNTSAELDYPTVLPTLDLDFANSKTLDPRITFTRASGGSYVGADGLIKYAGVNEARFDHDPETGESLGLLIEESRSNFFTWSENAQNGWNIKSSSPIIQDSVVAPDGSLAADSFIENPPSSGLRDHYLDRTTISQAANVPLTWSIYVKRLSGIRLIRLMLFANNITDTISATFNLDSVRVINNSTVGTGSILNSSIVPLPNGWFRLSISGTPSTSSVTDLRVRIQFINQSTTYIGDGISGIYIWGAQVEQGSFPTSYIPTQGSTRTRAKDNASITGKNFADFYNQQNSTLFISGRSPGNQTGARTFGGIVDTSVGFLSSIYFNISGSPNIVAWSPITGFSSLANYTQNTEIKGILSYTTTEPTARCCLDGGPVLSSFNRVFSYEGQTIFGFSKTMNRLTIGSTPWILDSPLNGTVSRMTYFPVQLSNSQLQALTS